MAWDKLDILGKEFGKKQGMETIPLSEEEEEKWVRATAPLLEKYVEYTKKKGIDGRSIAKFARKRMKEITSVPAYKVVWE